MQTEQIVALLIAERDRLSKAIEALQGPIKRRGRPPKLQGTSARPEGANAREASTSSKGRLSAAGRKAIADAARRRWAAIKAGKAVSPFAKNAGRK